MAPTSTSPMTLKRINREIADLQKEDLGPIVLEPSDNLHIWKGSIPGPSGSVYEGGVFLVEIQLPNDYPFSAPRVLFKTKIYHMNIAESGNICIDILKHNWSPALSLFKVMLSLSSLLTDPNPKDPLVPSIATQYIRSRKVHDDTARQWTHQFAQPPKPVPPTPPAPTPVAAPPTRGGRGKQRAAASATEGTAGASSSRPARAPARRTRADGEDVIMISDDEADASAKGKGKKRKRADEGTSSRATAASTNGAGASTSAGAGAEVLELDDSEAEAHAPAPAKKTRATRTKPPSSRASASQAGTRRSARNAAQTEDVIVIED